MTVGFLKGNAPLRREHCDGGLLVSAAGAPDHAHHSTFRESRQGVDFPELRQAIIDAEASGNYLAFCAARKALLLAQASTYFSGRS